MHLTALNSDELIEYNSQELEEWDKPIWDVRNLVQYGIKITKSDSHYLLRFNTIKNLKFIPDVKKYFKLKLLSQNKFTTGTAMQYLPTIVKFLNYISDIEPFWEDLSKLDRKHIEGYIEWLNRNYNGKSEDNKAKYNRRSINIIDTFLSDIQIREFSLSPTKDIKRLIFPTDKPVIPRKSADSINYIPDIVLDQLFNNINKIKSKQIVSIIWIMYKTGLRVSDVLTLKTDCLLKLNDSFWLECNVKKTYVIDHRIPIDDELANLIAVLINEVSLLEISNPEKFLFIRTSGKRSGNVYTTDAVRCALNNLAEKADIKDELGNRYKFKNHAFRHTYAVKMLNGGADILTVQELLAHSSPEMTMRYAKLLDDTKREVFDTAVKEGVFSFSSDQGLVATNKDEISPEVLDMLWINHKLKAIDTPYGTCLQRTKGNCQFAKQPPCLTCNGGNPCKDLCVGAFEGDIKKYEILIYSAKSMIENAKKYNREDMLNENTELLALYESVFNVISKGNIIYSKINRLKRKKAE